MTVLIVGVFLLAVIAYLLGGVVLTWITKLFKVENVSYKKSLLVLFFSGIIAFIAGVLFGIVSEGLISSILVTIVAFVAFHFLMNKYYQINWKKSLGIYFTYSVATLILALLIIIPVRKFVVQPFFVQGATMEPNFKDSDCMLINEFNRYYKRGDVVVFKYPKDESQFFIKRIIGLPGEKVEISQGIVNINGKVLDENSYLGNSIKTNGAVNLTLGSDEYFVMGDNRGFSSDSRAWGALKKNLIVGKHLITLYKK